MRAPRLSIVIPASNKREILEPMLDTLARQDYPADLFEVLVIDADRASNEMPAHLARRQDPFELRYETIPAADGFHVGRARNRGIEASTGEVVVFLDADVLAAPGLCRAYSALVAEGQPVVSLGYLFGYPHPASLRTPENLRPPPPAELLDALPRLTASNPRGWLDCREWAYALWPDFAGCPEPWTLCYSANFACPLELAKAVGGFDEKFIGWGLEDQEFAYRLFQRGGRFRGNRAAAGVHYPHRLRANMGEEFARNSRRFITKHRVDRRAGLVAHADRHGRSSALDGGGARRGGRRRAEVSGGTSRAAGSERIHRPRALLEILERRFGTQPYGWLGARPANPAPDGPRFEAVPFGGAPGLPNLLGLYTPVRDAELGTVVLVDYWRWLAPLTLSAVLVEMKRIARQVVLLSADPEAAAPEVSAESIELPGGVAYLVAQ